MYKLNENIRIKTCDDRTFLIDISTNSVKMISTEAKNLLEVYLANEKSHKDIFKSEDGFADFVGNLLNSGILEEERDET